MCTVSMIGDHYREKWEPRIWFDQAQTFTKIKAITRHEFDELKKEVQELKKLLKRATKYDKDNGEPECEVEDKMALVRKVAKAVGVELDDVLKPAPSD